MACSGISRKLIYQSAFIFLFTSLLIKADNPKLGFEISFRYPNNVFTVGIKHNPSDFSVGISYNYNQKNYFFTSESSPTTNPCIKIGADLFIDQLNIIAEQHQNNSKIKAYIQALHRKTFIKQKEEFNHLNKTENILKNLEAHYG